MRRSPLGTCRSPRRVAGAALGLLGRGCSIALCVIPLLVSASASALDPQRTIDQYAHDTWGVKDGLPEGPVLSLRPTSDGYLWVGAQNGLLRFDGDRFTLFEGGRLGLKPYSFARELLEGEQGEVWVALVGGVARFSGGRFSFFDQEQGLDHPFVYAIALGPGGSVWVGTGGTGVWQLRNGSFSRHPAYADPRLPTKVNDIAVDGQGTLWIATEDGVLEIGSSVRKHTIANGLGSDVANVLLFDRGGTLWVGTRAGLARRTGDRFRSYTTRDGLSHDDVTALLEDKEGSLWIGTHDGGLDRFAGGRFDHAPRSEGGIFALAEDHEGSLWVGSDRGLERYRDGAFVTFGQRQGFEYEQLLNIAVRRAGGLWVLDGSGAVLIHDGRQVRKVAPSGTIAGEGMLGFVEGPDGSLWVGGDVLHRFHDGRWDRYSNPGGAFDVVWPDGPGLLVAQTQPDGRSILSRFAGGRFEPVPTTVPLIHVQRLYRDRRERLWISTGGGGLVRVGPDGTRVFRSAEGLPHDTAYGMVEDAAGSLWVATRAGLARIRDDKVVSFAGLEGSPRPPVLHVAVDRRGFLWTTADDGVYRIRVSDLDAIAEGRARDVLSRRYATADGLRGLDVSWRCSAQALDEEGRLWYATGRGLAMVDPRSVPSAHPAPPVYIEDLLIGGRSAALADVVPVGVGRERIEVRFTAPSLNAADSVRFRYRLFGYDDEWVDDQARRAAHYTNVPAGRYTFRVAARQRDGDWGRKEAVLHLYIEPRWHETGLARLTGAGLVGLVLVGAYRLRVRHLGRREQILVRKVAERTEELRQEVAERRRAEEQVRALAEQLEARVRERTAQLETANEALANDVAERGRAEAALADEKERLSVTLRSLAEGVITTDVDGHVLLMNPVAERHTGWPSEEASGRPVSLVFRVVDRVTREPAEDPLGPALAARATAAAALSRVVLLDRGGGETLIEASAAPILDRGSAVVGAVLVFRDVTEKARAEEHLQRAQRLEAVGLLAAGIAHDFNNLLTVVYGYAESLMGDVRASESRHKIDEILRAARQSADLTRQLLAFSRRQVIQPAVLDLNAVISEATGMLRRVIGDDVTLSTVAGADIGRVRADLGQIEQIVMNLVLNGRDAMPDGGKLTLETSNADLDDAYARLHPPALAGRYVMLAVSDTGAGMDAATQAHVFDPFFTLKPEGRGSGLGLATVYGIVQQNGGFIGVYSEPGAGTTFKVYLPRVDEAPTPRPPPPVAAGQGGTETILLVEDHDIVREILTELLGALGYRVLGAASGEEAIAIAARNADEIALLLTDVKMPGMNGRDLARQLAELRPAMRVLYMSGYTAGAISQEGILDEGVALIEKPVPASKLAAKVREVLDAPEAPAR